MPRLRSVFNSRRFKLLSVLAFMATRNLLTKRLRSFLTILGVVIGVGSVFFLLSFSIGLQQLVQQQIIGNGAINTISVSTDGSQLLKLDSNAVDKISHLSRVTQISSSYTAAGKVSIEGAAADTVVYGVDQTYFNLNDISLKTGHLLDTTKDNQMLINSSLLQVAGLKNVADAVGKNLQLTFRLPNGKSVSRSLTVSGVIDSSSGTEVYVSRHLFSEQGDTTYSAISVAVANRNDITYTRHQIESLGFTTSSPYDTIDQVNQIFRYFNFILIGFGSIGMTIAILGMLNTITVTLLERLQENALLLTLGARPKDLRRLFALEGSILSLIGGVVGIILAILIGRVIDLVLNQIAATRGVTQAFQLFAVPPLLIVSVLVFMVLIGYVVSFLPARRAANANPIDALRHE